MKIVRFKNGKYGIRKVCFDPVVALFEWCPFKFLQSWAVAVDNFTKHTRLAKDVVDGWAWVSKSRLTKEDVYDTAEQAQEAFTKYLQNLAKAEAAIADATFDCGTPPV